MERLTKDLASMIAHVESLPGNPSFEQLEAKTKGMSDAIKRDSNSAPGRIKQLIVENFNSIGWDVRRSKVTKLANFTSAGLLHALKELAAQIENWDPPVAPTDEELADLSLACDKLWQLDAHRLVPDVDYVLNLQRGKKSYDRDDVAIEPLFSFVDEAALAKPTYAAFVALLDNYSAKTGIKEVVTREELEENRKFLELLMDTAVMQYTHRYLLSTHKTKASTREQFINELNDLWFGLYSRKAHNDSSGFEHVFLGEIKDDQIVGFHNWIRIYLEEKNNRTFDYRGYIKPRRRGCHNSQPHSQEQLVTIQFEWQGAMKNVSSSLIGTSPEFEVALYTLCFYSGQNEDDVRLGPYRAKITCYTWPAHPRHGQKVYIATSFPSELPLDEDEAATRIQKHARGRHYRNNNRG
mmetsp:Transcript_22199/g.37160  ORF Transcript_22199/g.37160 Transcript_22199/m.37160 type:complete len:409 (-) Transcript_22199:1567-2793(-)|eukprot:CAMPEP_0174965052 /NCGR_PEP_ID=MMETSP0004_2-20121128/6227_1 /TAXON_ID=420556 /ORGANISM="Ochromonas sp., Strain CCMP1393" /LENGTH=408 /DNA_ID=CAMNT_0016213857 /DNA_START=9 /DNA_END=1235 /DNA_ORIENTATION=-